MAIITAVALGVISLRARLANQGEAVATEDRCPHRGMGAAKTLLHRHWRCSFGRDLVNPFLSRTKDMAEEVAGWDAQRGLFLAARYSARELG